MLTDRLDPGMIVRHFKREMEDTEDFSNVNYLYYILSFAQHTETKERLVVYKALYGEGNIFARPADMFMSKVDREKYPDIKQQYRFEQATPDDMARLVMRLGYVDRTNITKTIAASLPN